MLTGAENFTPVFQIFTPVIWFFHPSRVPMSKLGALQGRLLDSDLDLPMTVSVYLVLIPDGDGASLAPL